MQWPLPNGGVLSARCAIRVNIKPEAWGSSLQSVILVVGCGTGRLCTARNEISGWPRPPPQVTHSWDLARSGGLPTVIDPIVVDMALATSQMAVSPELGR